MSLERDNQSSPGFWDWAITLVKVGYLFFMIQLSITFVDVLTLVYHNPRLTSFMRSDLGRCRMGESCRLEITWRNLSAISPDLQKAVLVAEDPHFYHHGGIDGEAMGRAFALNFQEGRIVRGASTLPQQLSKNLYLSPSKSPWRKFKEILISLFMDRVLSKQRILELYLNVVEWGPHIYGAESASRFYFDKPASMLSKEEAAFLVSLLPNPIVFADPSRRSEVLEQARQVLDAMNNPSYQGEIEPPE